MEQTNSRNTNNASPRQQVAQRSPAAQQANQQDSQAKARAEAQQRAQQEAQAKTRAAQQAQKSSRELLAGMSDEDLHTIIDEAKALVRENSEKRKESRRKVAETWREAMGSLNQLKPYVFAETDEEFIDAAMKIRREALRKAHETGMLREVKLYDAKAEERRQRARESFQKRDEKTGKHAAEDDSAA